MTDEGDDEEEDDEDELSAGYLLWLCLFFKEVTPLLQLGLSAPGKGRVKTGVFALALFQSLFGGGRG